MGLGKTSCVVKCELCGMEMKLEEGTKLYADKWFHNSCSSLAMRWEFVQVDKDN